MKDFPHTGKQKKGKGAPTKKKRRQEKLDKGLIKVSVPKSRVDHLADHRNL